MSSRITQLTALTTADNDDLFEVVDVSDTTMAASGTNKQITKAELLANTLDYSLVSEASSATPTATGTARRNDYVATALAENATLAAPSGTANTNALIRYRITASGGTRTIGYNAALEAGNITRTTSLPAGSTLTQVYQRANGKWTCLLDDVTT